MKKLYLCNGFTSPGMISSKDLESKLPKSVMGNVDTIHKEKFFNQSRQGNKVTCEQAAVEKYLSSSIVVQLAM